MLGKLPVTSGISTEKTGITANVALSYILSR